jgi:hypothetical protein
MSELLAFLRTNPVVLAILAGVGIATLVLGFISILMLRAGMSLRPIVFIAVFMLIVAGPQVAFHVSQAMGWIPARELTWIPKKDRGAMYGFRENESVTAVVDGKFVHARQLFGPDADTTLVSDLTRIPGGPFSNAEVAQMVVVPPAGSVVAARFADEGLAQAAGMTYVGQATGTASAPGADGMWTVQRPAGDWMKGIAAGRTLIFASGATEAEATARLYATGAFTANDSDPDVTPEARNFWLYQPRALIGITAVLLLLAAGWFFRGSSWAATSLPDPATPAQSAAEVRRRLLAVNALDVPYTITEDDRGRIVVTYRFADARWVDLARAHGMRRTHRILLEFDESSHSVRPTEQHATLDWSAGADGGSVRWSATAGIIFFQQEHTRVFGLQVGKDGRFTPQLSYAYTFNLQEMKAPFIQAVLGAGWRWRPVIWHAPAALRWLTG